MRWTVHYSLAVISSNCPVRTTFAGVESPTWAAAVSDAFLLESPRAIRLLDKIAKDVVLQETIADLFEVGGTEAVRGFLETLFPRG